MPASKDFQLYFIALIPPEPFFSEVLGLKNEVKDRFNSKAALNSPPHVTLHMPFRFKERNDQFHAISILSKEAVISSDSEWTWGI
jgi:2'-5' RNA ligase